MGLYVGSTLVFPNGVLTAPNAANNGSTFYSDGAAGYWAYPGSTASTVGTGWRYRTIYTHGFIAAGYKGGNPWRSVNKTWHPSDTTVYMGEQIDKAASYIDGAWSDYNAYVYGTSDAHSTASSHTSSYSLFNGTRRMQATTNYAFYGAATVPFGYTGNNPGGTLDNPSGSGIAYGTAWNASTNPNPQGVGGWDLPVTKTNHGCATAIINQVGYVFGGGNTTVAKHHFPTEIMYTSATAAPQTWAATCAVGGQTQAYIAGLSTAAGIQRFTYSNDTFTSWSGSWDTGVTSDGVNKALMSKYGWFYFGRDTNTVANQYKFNDDATGTKSALLSKLSNFGEENYEMGQDWGYMLGMFNGQQNNWTTKYTYSTDGMLTLGSAAQPKGHVGTSSGCCSTAAMSIVSVNRM